MALYRVRAGRTLGHHGRVLKAGETVDLSDDVASDLRVAEFVELVPTAPPVSKTRLPISATVGVSTNGADSK